MVDISELGGTVMAPQGQKAVFMPVSLPAFPKYSCPKPGGTAHAGFSFPMVIKIYFNYQP